MRARRTIAITVWGERISPVFDSARTLLIVEVDGNTISKTAHLTFDPDRPLELVQMLQRQQVALVICGAVSEQPATILETAGIQLLPFVAGKVSHVLERYCKGRSLGPEFRMPGCGNNFCCRGKIRQGREITLTQPPRRQGRRRRAGCADLLTHRQDDVSEELPKK
ncbi:MAG: hypothetical protein GXY53_04720 [Desulfobulbus sp.]|nr:hypothetical protein [Desulfobulbus sp.]